MFKDPIVEEVRRAREELARECGYDLHKIMEKCQKTVQNWKGKKVTKEELIRGRKHTARKR